MGEIYHYHGILPIRGISNFSRISDHKYDLGCSWDVRMTISRDCYIRLYPHQLGDHQLYPSDIPIVVAMSPEYLGGYSHPQIDGKVFDGDLPFHLFGA